MANLKQALHELNEQEDMTMEVKVVILEKGKGGVAKAREIKLEPTGDSKNYRKFSKSPTEEDRTIATVYVPK